MENQNGIPISKRTLAGGGAMVIIMGLCKSPPEQAELAALGMKLIFALAIIYIIADGIKSWRQKTNHGKEDRT